MELKGLKTYNELVKFIDYLNDNKKRLINKRTGYAVMEVNPIPINKTLTENETYYNDVVSLVYENHEETNYYGQHDIKTMYRYLDVIDDEE